MLDLSLPRLLGVLVCADSILGAIGGCFVDVENDGFFALAVTGAILSRSSREVVQLVVAYPQDCD